MKVAITGASGLVGSALTKSLEADGHTVLPVIRREIYGDIAVTNLVTEVMPDPF